MGTDSIRDQLSSFMNFLLKLELSYIQVVHLCLLRVYFEMDTKPTFAQSIDNVWNMWEGNKEDAWHRLISRRPLGAIYGQTCQSRGSFWSFSVDKDLGSSVQFKILRTWQFPWKQQSRSYQDCKWSKSDFNHVGLTAACIKWDYFFTVLLPLIKNMIFVIQKCKHNIALKLSLWELLRLDLIDWGRLLKHF